MEGSVCFPKVTILKGFHAIGWKQKNQTVYKKKGVIMDGLGCREQIKRLQVIVTNRGQMGLDYCIIVLAIIPVWVYHEAC